MRLIDADRFKEYITVSEDVLSLFKTEEFNQLVVSTMEAILRDIDAQPTVNAVEAVRCKDCKYFELNHWDGIIITAHEICNKWEDGCKTNKDGYCFLGERKTNDS